MARKRKKISKSKKIQSAATKWLRKVAHVGVLALIVLTILLPFLPTSSLIASASSSIKSAVWPAYKSIDYSTNDPVYSESNPVPVFEEGIVTVTFDDGWDSIYTSGLQIMENYDINSTQYLISGSLNKKLYMTNDQVEALVKGGHQIASHTVSHPNLTNSDEEDLAMELRKSKEELQKDFGPIYDFASPLGAFNQQTISEIKKNYRSHRSTQTGINLRSDFDMYNIKVQNIKPNTTIEQVEAWIAEAKSQNGWLVLVYHQVQDDGDDYSVAPEEFDKQLGAIKNSGLKTATMGQVVNSLQR